MPTLAIFDEDACVAALTYLAQRVGDVVDVELGQLLYLAEKLHLERYGRFICGDRYLATDDGPVPALAYDALRALARGEALDRPDARHLARRLGGHLVHAGGDRFRVTTPADDSELSDSDIECLDDVADMYVRASFAAVRAAAHDAAYEGARAREANAPEVAGGGHAGIARRVGGVHSARGARARAPRMDVEDIVLQLPNGASILEHLNDPHPN